MPWSTQCKLEASPCLSLKPLFVKFGSKQALHYRAGSFIMVMISSFLLFIVRQKRILKILHIISTQYKLYIRVKLLESKRHSFLGIKHVLGVFFREITGRKGLIMQTLLGSLPDQDVQLFPHIFLSG